MKAIAHINPPKNNEPVSPINTLAGCILNIKNPKHPPISAPVTMLKFIMLKKPAISIKNIATKNVIDVHKPSIPSVKFTALTIPTINNAAIGQ